MSGCLCLLIPVDFLVVNYYITQSVHSQEHCTNQVTITLMMTLLPDQVTFIFHLREIVITSGNRIYLFPFLQESFHFHILFLIC